MLCWSRETSHAHLLVQKTLACQIWLFNSKVSKAYCCAALHHDSFQARINGPRKIQTMSRKFGKSHFSFKTSVSVSRFSRDRPVFLFLIQGLQEQRQSLFWELPILSAELSLAAKHRSCHFRCDPKTSHSNLISSRCDVNVMLHKESSDCYVENLIRRLRSKDLWCCVDHAAQRQVVNGVACL